jgi:hypothetical protein
MAKRKKKAARAGRKKVAPKRKTAKKAGKTAKKAARAKKASSKSSRSAKRARKTARKRTSRPATAVVPRASTMAADETAMEAELLPELDGDNDRMEFP